MFEIKEVSKTYHGETVLNNVTLTIGKGLNFIVGASGSGKTTLLKIITGMDQDFEGEVSYCGQNIKGLNQKEKSYLYNTCFGFVWQDFNLLEHSTVLENVRLPQYLKNNQSQKSAEKILKELKIIDLADQKVKYLSGGQKQRVAIARELMKNPQVIIADEPTSALDEKTSKATMDLLRAIAKNRTVIVVTHDTTLMEEQDAVYALDKGVLVSGPKINAVKVPKINTEKEHRLSLKNAFNVAKGSIKSKYSRFAVSVLTLVTASVLLLSAISGAVGSSSQDEFDKLRETYGEALNDIGIYNSFFDAAAADGAERDQPSASVQQDISGLYDQYAKDERVSFVAYLQAFDNIRITLDDKEHPIKSSGSVPSINQLVAGKMPMGDENEVVVPESMVKQWGISPEEAVGKTIKFDGAIMDWTEGNPVSKEITSTAEIVGVMDTTIKYDYAGQMTEYTVDDAFLFSKAALSEMQKQAGMDINTMNFLIRAKTPADMIAIKDELSSQGIVPIGRFELVEDMVRLNRQTTDQSSSATVIIGCLAFMMVGSVFLITGFMRKKEYAIYKVSGYSTAHLFLINGAEMLSVTAVAIGVMLMTSPLLNIITKGIFGVTILNIKMLSTGCGMILLMGVLAFLSTAITCAKVNAGAVLKSGEQG